MEVGGGGEGGGSSGSTRGSRRNWPGSLSHKLISRFQPAQPAQMACASEDLMC